MSYNDQWSYVGGFSKKDEDVRKSAEEEEKRQQACDHNMIKTSFPKKEHGRLYYEYRCNKCKYEHYELHETEE